MRYLILAIFYATPIAADSLSCQGETPFWTLDLNFDNSSAAFSRDGGAEKSANIDLTALAQGNNAIQAHSITNQINGFTGIAVTAPASCTVADDDRYSHRIEFLTQEGREAILLTGCCRAAPSE